MTLFRTPERPASLTFMLRGEPGTGKTRFALGLTRHAARKKPVAVIGAARGASFYAGDTSVGPFVHVDASKLSEFDAALKELKRRSRSFGGVILDSVTDWWNLELEAHEVETKDGGRVVPPRAWRVIREEREKKLRILQSLPMHVVLICEERPIFERVGEDLREVGTREDTDKKDSYIADVRLRFFTKDGRVCAEVLKDRTGRYAMGTILTDPTLDLWLAPEAAGPSLEERAKEIIEQIGSIHTAEAWRRWRWKRARELDGLLAALSDGMTKASLVAIAKAKSGEFSDTPRPEATA